MPKNPTKGNIRKVISLLRIKHGATASPKVRTPSLVAGFLDYCLMECLRGHGFEPNSHHQGMSGQGMTTVHALTKANNYFSDPECSSGPGDGITILRKLNTYERIISFRH